MLHGWSGTLTTTPGPFELQAYPAFRGSKASLSVCVCETLVCVCVLLRLPGGEWHSVQYAISCACVLRS